MLYGERIAVCSEIHIKHVNKAELYYRLSPCRSVNTPDRVLKIDNLMLYRETVAIYSEIHIKQENETELCCRLSPYREVNTPLLGFKNQSFNALWRNNRGLFRDPYKTRK
jgi:hypothetical protein